MLSSVSWGGPKAKEEDMEEAKKKKMGNINKGNKSLSFFPFIHLLFGLPPYRPWEPQKQTSLCIITEPVV